MKLELGPTARAIYIELDTIFDTRLGIVSQHHPELLDLVLNNSNYHNRVINQWPGLSQSRFNDLYASRDNHTLKESPISNALTQIRSLVFDFNRELINEPFRTPPTVVLNIHPYQISKTVQIALVDQIKHVLGEYVPVQVELIDQDPLIISLIHASNNYSVMVMYHGLQWFESQHEQIGKGNNPRLKLVAPALHFDTDIEDPEVAEELRKTIEEIGMHPFEFTEQFSRSVIDLNLEPISMFSIISPKGR